MYTILILEPGLARADFINQISDCLRFYSTGKKISLSVADSSTNKKNRRVKPLLQTLQAPPLTLGHDPLHNPHPSTQATPLTETQIPLTGLSLTNYAAPHSATPPSLQELDYVTSAVPEAPPPALPHLPPAATARSL